MQTSKQELDQQLTEKLKSVFGFDSFRGNQLEIIKHTLHGHDGLVIMPTGGGKSMCYQLPALMGQGLTIVVSPLIALMTDQVTNLRSYNIGANYINSTLSNAQKREVFQSIENGKTKLLYISPEKAVMPRFIQYIQTKQVDLVAIDEAHCVSIWGNDFRPVYTQLISLLQALPAIPVMALTATADRATQVDICQKLKMKTPRIFISSFERKNIHILVRPAQGRLQQVLAFIKQHRGQAGIIYCLSRKSTEELALKLRNAGLRAAHYHAELSSSEREKIQHAFQRDELQIVCATIAFGMGIDKSNIRWVIHYNLPKNIESYYQEIGRAGRDGSPAEALLFYNFHDISIFRRFIDESEADSDFKNVQHQKLDRIWEFTQATNCRTNLILNYFGEYRDKPCMHCDICTHPPQGFNGNTLTQKALKTCIEAGQNLTLPMLIDVLRASGRKEIYSENLHKLSNYGSGRELSRNDWIHYLTQMINQGFIMIDYTKHSILKCTTLSQDALDGKLNIKLTKPIDPKFIIREVKPPGKNEEFNNNLLNDLKKWRREQAAEENVPAYIVLTDRVLKEIATRRPTTLLDLINISGIGDHKLEKYGKAIIKNIQEFIQHQEILKNVKGQSSLESFYLLKEGYHPKDIAQIKGIKLDRVFDHLIDLYKKGEDIDLQQFISEPIMHEVVEGWRFSGGSFDPAVVAEFIQSPVPMHQIKIVLSIIRKQKSF
ncbi:MAG: DNA helicase RecQ [Saprospiraceae bacterium]|nr:DNA helicase RecQ [Saprospiraceae bacterium]